MSLKRKKVSVIFDKIINFDKEEWEYLQELINKISIYKIKEKYDKSTKI